MKAWHVSVVSTALLIISELIVYVAARRLRGMTAHRLTGMLALAVLAGLVVAGVVIFGMELMNQLAGIASAVMAAVAIRLTYQSYRSRRDGDRQP